ncbi:T-cell activation inhibitor, mitochondrial isoform X1 [Phyllopteryx taeniolatus]|uniref:T-cell activation inhibitor, mitochondrial isoform X1 n=2 Tax=Phyllopteryx taeniolatus TaxID=161469 RepID=UPI002AD27A8C|nr:T-cell activation inhibitor, mitochondrial isoform X1 [Phyllopteryx taeniolatus]XP_061631399.1 T-cell activation inhibitor, mitochondrial isoform X1 [Phyllopteryx taeniolatus]XP_061631400.1 T-cell activation inhibitor, mitochondrial isoform X1 [Phyllopteryx taeniolatus]XP_061631401.1 T-cell activation inhibitor, mitochondrial isoform X1 [Phyllopteryx taeniolatus]XP_061631402.1 T-cell activation inhibitor, mitochondrial isoform X1 [Phyllopteryx taeniolatus]XP_061631403.1 T-cell activation in
MSVHCLLRCTIRVERKHVATHLFLQRALSGADAVNALRPFYFAVHPDFFGQYPREREVNENSLKRLNGYLENLQKTGSRSVQPMKLTFYVRDTKDSSDVQQDLLTSGFRSVSFVLHTNDILSTVTNVLKSCSLSMEHIKGLKAVAKAPQSPAEAAIPFYRPIKWDKSYYTFTGFRDPEEELQQATRVEPTLNMWLQNNESEATKKLNNSLPRREELKRLKKELCHKFDLADIRWQRSWGVAHRCSQLQSLNRLSMQNPEAMLNLQGHTVVFADQSGMNASGHAMLGTTDVHHQWSKLFEQLPGFRVLHQQTEWLKERISLLLGGTQVAHAERLGPVEPITELYRTLNTFHNNLISQRLCLHPRSLEGLNMILEKGRSSPGLHEMGHFIIPTNCDLLKLQAFLQSHAPSARQRSQNRKLLQAEEEAAMKLCLQSLSLQDLSKEPSVTSSQIILCCKRLLGQRSPLMLGLHVCVSHFYSVTQDGDLCIPWDWKG